MVLIPMWWGGFSEMRVMMNNLNQKGLNPHVVGRFFRDPEFIAQQRGIRVLIPMWWGGFSEA